MITKEAITELRDHILSPLGDWTLYLTLNNTIPQLRVECEGWDEEKESSVEFKIPRWLRRHQILSKWSYWCQSGDTVDHPGLVVIRLNEEDIATFCLDELNEAVEEFHKILTKHIDIFFE